MFRDSRHSNRTTTVSDVMNGTNLQKSQNKYGSYAWEQAEQSGNPQHYSESRKRRILDKKASTSRNTDYEVDRRTHHLNDNGNNLETLRSIFGTSEHDVVDVKEDDIKQYNDNARYRAYESGQNSFDYRNKPNLHLHSNAHKIETDKYVKRNGYDFTMVESSIRHTSATHIPASSTHEKYSTNKCKSKTINNDTRGSDKKEANRNSDLNKYYTNSKDYTSKTQGSNENNYQDPNLPRSNEHYSRREQITENYTKVSDITNTFDNTEKQLRNSPGSDKSNGQLRLKINSDTLYKMSCGTAIENQKQTLLGNETWRQVLDRDEKNVAVSKTYSRQENNHQRKYGDSQVGYTENDKSDKQCTNTDTWIYREKSKEFGKQMKPLVDRPASDTYIGDKKKDGEREKLIKIKERLRLKRLETEKKSIESRQTKYSNHFENCNDELSSLRIAEKFKYLYDIKWAGLCRWMCKTFRNTPEIKIVQYLSLLMKSCYKECVCVSDNQIRQFLLLKETEVIPKHEEHPELFALRKQYAQRDDIRKKVRETIKDKVHIEESLSIFDQEINGVELLEKVETFVDEFTDSCWMITVSEPAISLNFDVVGKMYSDIADHFSVFSLKKPVTDPTKTEGTVYEVVWPSVQLKFSSEIYKKGDVIVIKKNTKTISTQT